MVSRALCWLVGASLALSSLGVCASPVSNVDWSTLTKETLAALEPAEFLTLTPAQLASIPEAACAGFAAAQLDNVGGQPGSAVCTGFQPPCFVQVPSAATDTGLMDQCFSQLSYDVVGNFTSAQLAGFGPICASLNNTDQTGALNGAQCGYLTTACLQVIPVDTVPGLQLECIQALSSTQVAAFTAASIGNIDLSAITGISRANNDEMTAGCSGFTAEQFGLMATSAWKTWSDDCSKAFSPAGLDGWTRVQMRGYPRRQFYMWSIEQVRGLGQLGVSGISPAIIKSMPATHCQGFRKEQLPYLRDFFTQHVCEQITAECMGNVTATEYAGWGQECVQRLRPLAFASVSGEQLSFMSPSTFFILRNKQINALHATTCSGITARQMNFFDLAYPSTQCTALLPECTMQLSENAVAGMTNQCNSHLSLEGLGAAFFKFVTAEGFSNWQGRQCKILVPETADALQPEVFGSMSPTCASSLTPVVLARLSADQCAHLSAKSLEVITDAVALSDSCLGALPAATCADLSATFLNQYANHTSSTNALTPECVLALSCDVVPALAPSVLASFNLTADVLDSLCAVAFTIAAPSPLPAYLYSGQQLAFSLGPSAAPLANLTLSVSITNCAFVSTTSKTLQLVYTSTTLQGFTLQMPTTTVNTTVTVTYALTGPGAAHFITPAAVSLVVYAQSVDAPSKDEKVKIILIVVSLSFAVAAIVLCVLAAIKKNRQKKVAAMAMLDEALINPSDATN